MVVDHEKKCDLCFSPTLHRKDMNLGQRCFFFPKCSGQVDLFGTAQESLTFLDFETTGLNIGKDSIIEIGAVKLDGSGDFHTFQTLVKPPEALTPVITKITGITDSMLTNAPPPTQSMEKLISFIGSSKIVVHNADFDILWLMRSALRYNLPIDNNSVICTLKWARLYQEPHCSLSALTKKYRITHNNAHRALADAAATKELFFIFESFGKIKRPVQTLNDFIKPAQRLVDKYADQLCA
ncbi:exonuclease domain-containing protein [Thermoproteota archaeon]